MPDKFKVWIGVERENTDAVRPSGEFTDLDPQFGSEGEFDTEEEAMELAKRIHSISRFIQHDRDELVEALASIMHLFDVKSYEVADVLDAIRAETSEQHSSRNLIFKAKVRT